MKTAKAGFSLIELMVVVAIAIIITAIALPSVRRTITSYQLDSSSRALASMLQQTRMAAVKNNTPYYAQFNATVVLNGGGAPVTLNNEVIAIPAPRLTQNPPSYMSNQDPTIAVANNVAFLPAGGVPPTHTQLETAMGVPAGTAQIGVLIGFNARGVPCTQDPINPNAWLCTTGPVAFEWFMQNNMTQSWAAVTVSPTGRIRSWRMSSPGVWQ